MASREEFVQDQNGSRELDRRYQNDFSRRKYVCLGVIAGIGVVLTVIGCTLIILYMTRNGQPTQTSPHGDQTEYIATEQVNTVQACYGSHDKQTFPDIGYALMGYNIFKGYPQAAGHDPGFTYPIFKANYSENSFSSDCRYLMPTGLVALPDMSCVTSFSSKTVKTERDFSESLHQSAEVSGSVWGSSFSLSEDYHRTVSEISTGNYVYSKTSKTRILKGIMKMFEFSMVLEFLKLHFMRSDFKVNSYKHMYVTLLPCC